MLPSTLTKIVVLWIWIAATPTMMADVPRAKGWHIWGSYPSFETCAEAISDVRRDRKRNGVTGPLLAACKIKKNAWTSPLLVMHDGSDNLHWRWVLWRYYGKNWTLLGRKMTPGWFSLSVWDSKRGCEDARLRMYGVPLSYKKCLRADKFPGENADLLREHGDVSGDLGQAR